MYSFISVFSYFCCHRVAAEDEQQPVGSIPATAEPRGRRGLQSRGRGWDSAASSGTGEALLPAGRAAGSQRSAGCLWGLLAVDGASRPLWGFWCSYQPNAHYGTVRNSMPTISYRTWALWWCFRFLLSFLHQDEIGCVQGRPVPIQRLQLLAVLCGTFHEQKTQLFT